MLNRYAELPVTVDGARAEIHGKINDSDVRLTIDTGAVFSVLNPATVERLGLRLEPFGMKVGGFGGSADVKVATVKTFTVAGVPMRDAEFLVPDHDTDSADGTVGENLVGYLDAEFDFADGALRLFKPDGCGDRALAYWDPNAQGAMSIDSVVPPNM